MKIKTIFNCPKSFRMGGVSFHRIFLILKDSWKDKSRFLTPDYREVIGGIHTGRIYKGGWWLQVNFFGSFTSCFKASSGKHSV